jgi:hypothetical protein
MQFFEFCLNRVPQRSLLAGLGLAVLLPVAAVAVEVVDYTASNTFTLNVDTGNPNQDFGSVYVESDSATGWILKVKSTQNGTLEHNDSEYSIVYSLVVDGVQVGSLTSGNDVTVKSVSSLTCPPPEGCSYSVQATLLSSDIADNPAGDYTDTLVFNLVNQ